MKTVMLTGASGFIGSALLEDLLRDHFVLAFGRHFRSKRVASNLAYIEGDLNDMKSSDFQHLLPGGRADICVHAAGQAHIPAGGASNDILWLNNAKATYKSLNLAKELQIDKFIYLSSVVVYNGNCNDAYEQSKRHAEAEVLSFCQKHRIRCVVIRPTMVYGIGEPGGHLLALIDSIRRGAILLPHAGRRKRIMIYIKNLVFVVGETVRFGLYDDSVLVARDEDPWTLLCICRYIREQIHVRCLLIPVPSLVVKSAIIAVNLLRFSGLFKHSGVRSLRNLNKQIDYPIEPINRELLARLPYTVSEALSETLRSLKK
ncbi:NAD-dependent epimerase/dehydratase family protein [Saccharibacillus sp. CPCC 101409]|uniref:NAD-dependent epimerase/dehydratase family protein n=1 Tax=Saccharibacillus sp. CPCC 101409 TaxID=3058041 RepID=UPI002671E155|nr:NAD-dependent epimerase/dehydratase family protein [Saccharibacillus sp. CPCC 101409]MDO3412024.1 NAD-dependent epimerase/dehydratase family protein [Saccharibacillus sp. CPCC 101409]